ncbi:hypothetical protein [Streptomyces sp. AC627_RSS907]|uniref:hypothetical protein n=1 Tax=Streptomyces sp. AC627_RSS907 TaxID=2823684 RepID=UPI001C24BC1E|nr:hypothetical protein [Streptomyces sp. AC627_RSS907]
MQRKGGHRQETGDPRTEPVESVLDELYTAPPDDFVPRREEHAAAARTAGRKDDARRIHAARRPTLAAWAANLLTRSLPEESRRFLELGQALREAHRTLDAAGLKELSAQRRRIVSALSRQAARLAREAGHPLSEAAQREVESTLRAVLADPDAAGQWADGRLTGSLTPPSEFPPGTAPAGSAPRERSPRPAFPGPSAGARAKDELAERRRRRQEELARAEQMAREASRQLSDRRAEQADAEASLRRVNEEHDRAREEVSAAEQRLRQARERLDRVERERREAEEAGRAVATALARAERQARSAAREVDRSAPRPR